MYYEQFCRDNTDISFYPESVYLMWYHDLDDAVGEAAIYEHFGADSIGVCSEMQSLKMLTLLTDGNLGVVDLTLSI
ncbi:MAG: hypothetical protein K2J29_02585 [Muribaculaceae bacterium]|nr:hypothetical protein [Muribaculaceae bacterium]